MLQWVGSIALHILAANWAWWIIREEQRQSEEEDIMK